MAGIGDRRSRLVGHLFSSLWGNLDYGHREEVPNTPQWVKPQLFLAPKQAADPIVGKNNLTIVPRASVPNVSLAQLFLAPAQAADPTQGVNNLRVVPRASAPLSPSPQVFLAPAQAGDPLAGWKNLTLVPRMLEPRGPNPALYIFVGTDVLPPPPLPAIVVPRSLVPGVPPSTLFLVPSQAGDPLPFPALHTVSRISVPLVALPSFLETLTGGGPVIIVPPPPIIFTGGGGAWPRTEREKKRIRERIEKLKAIQSLEAKIMLLVAYGKPFEAMKLMKELNELKEELDIFDNARSFAKGKIKSMIR